jgi:hypothetical protein
VTNAYELRPQAGAVRRADDLAPLRAYKHATAEEIAAANPRWDPADVST